MWGDQVQEVVEFNARLGDPEAQVLAIHDSRDWGAMILDHLGIKALDKAAYTVDATGPRSVAVVMAGEGYPYEKPKEPVAPLAEGIFANKANDTAVFGAAVVKDGDVLKPGGGRVLSVVCKDEDFSKARKGLGMIAEISTQWPKAQFRKDIAKEFLKAIRNRSGTIPWESKKEFVRNWQQGLVCLRPTDTLPGLSFNPASPSAKQTLFALKNRDESKTCISWRDRLGLPSSL